MAAAFLVYGNTLFNGFVWDDHILIEHNAFMQEPRNLGALLNPRFYLENQRLRSGSRPVLLASLLVDRALWGASPGGYHLTNLLLHTANAFWVYRLALVLWAPAPLAALGAGLLFLLHPIQTEAVNAISFRADLLSSFFVLAGLWTLRRAQPGPRRFAAAVVCAGCLYALGLLAKESAVVLPAAVCLAELFMPTKIWTRRRAAAALALGAVVTLSYAAFRAPRFRYAGLNDVPAQEDDEARRLAPAPVRDYVFDPHPPLWEELFHDPALRLRTMSVEFARNLSLLAWPQPLVVDRAPELVRSWASAGLWLSWLLLAALAAGLAALRARHPPAAFGLAFGIAALLPTAGFIPIFNPVAERYLYAATAGIAWALAYATTASRWRTGTTALAALAALAACGARAWARNGDWRSDATLFDSAPAGAKQNPRVLYNRARVRLAEGRPDAALAEYRAALRLHPGFVEAWLNLGTLYTSIGRDADARLCYDRAVALSDRSPMPRFVLAKFLERRGETTGAEAMYRSALGIYPGFQPARVRLGLLYERLGKAGEARKEFQTALGFEPKNQTALEAMARLREP